MTKEELEKKAKQYSSKYARQYYHNDKSGFTTSEEEVCKAYIAGAKEIQEETLKEIIEIEKTSDYRWEENQQLKQKLERLKKAYKNFQNAESDEERTKTWFKLGDLLGTELAE